MPKPVLGYAVVGGIGFLVDAGVMVALTSLVSWSPIAARAVSFPAAVTVTWILNRNWTFNHSGDKVPHKHYSVYLVIQIIGAAINFALFSALIATSAQMNASPVIALAIGAIVSMVFTYTMSKRFVFFASPPHRP